MIIKPVRHATINHQPSNFQGGTFVLGEEMNEADKQLNQQPNTLPNQRILKPQTLIFLGTLVLIIACLYFECHRK